MIDILKKIAVFSMVGIFLTILGNVINDLVNWSWLVTVCKILRVVIDPLDFFIDTVEFISALGSALSAYVALWVARGAIVVINLVKNK